MKAALDRQSVVSNAMRMGDVAWINWRSRGYLPHFDALGMCQHVVFGLADAIPDRTDVRDVQAANILRAYDAELDAGHGDCLLRDPRCARIVQDELLLHDGIGIGFSRGA